MQELRVSDKFEYPGLRHCKISDSSGEEFYHNQLNHQFKLCFERKERLRVILDGTAGYAPSFLDEAFGNLVYDFDEVNVRKYLVLVSDDEPEWIEMLEMETFPDWQKRRLSQKAPMKTAEHKDWWRYVNGSFKQVNVT